MSNTLPAMFKLAMFASNTAAFGNYFRYDEASGRFMADTDNNGGTLFFHESGTEHVYFINGLGNRYLTWQSGAFADPVIATDVSGASSIHTSEDNQGRWNLWFPNKAVPNGWGLQQGNQLWANQLNSNFTFAVSVV